MVLIVLIFEGCDVYLNNVDEDYLSEIHISDEIKFGLTADYELLAKPNDDFR